MLCAPRSQSACAGNNESVGLRVIPSSYDQEERVEWVDIEK
jgi:hypothetical protein